jgi:hypothetical protein
VEWLDGVSVTFDDWHFNVRPSNTEPLLRLNMEAKTPENDGSEAGRAAGDYPRLSYRQTIFKTRSLPFLPITRVNHHFLIGLIWDLWGPTAVSPHFLPDETGNPPAAPAPAIPKPISVAARQRFTPRDAKQGDRALLPVLTAPDAVRDLWRRLDPLSQKAVAFAYHRGGHLDQFAFRNQYGQLPARPQEEKPMAVAADAPRSLPLSGRFAQRYAPASADLVPPPEKFRLRGVA